ncbi:metallophosphoesterase [Clostridium sp. D2Q-11]|uniref:Metallophosphoesterase n=1 Tax=Anaeromonas frigoriresistens TaxID=2683708 RepID=A0A942Z9L0_9FIRM|nr:metallophosphoesterase [Anaeromonas frigoriresistens]MBS4539259.1 metallophosphoesterase [Anaeromonas frigoriresistens]
MAIYGIADLHLDPIGDKPMDVFSDKWINHEENIFNNWINKITDDDIVLIPGDISWALKLKDALIDLKKIEKLPGYKIIGKGNHDYWWETKSKLDKLGLEDIHFLYNDGYKYKNFGIAGTRGWCPKDSDEFKEKDIKIFDRELNRLKLSLEKIKDIDRKIVMIHYPPFNSDGAPNEFTHIMKEYNVEICVYGHLHAEGHKHVKEGMYNGINYICIASDFIDFDPIKILD